MVMKKAIFIVLSLVTASNLVSMEVKPLLDLAATQVANNLGYHSIEQLARIPEERQAYILQEWANRPESRQRLNAFGCTLGWSLEQTLTNPSAGRLDDIESVIISQNGNSIVSGSWNGALDIWKNRRGQWRLEQELEDPGSIIYSIWMSPDEQTIISGGNSKSIDIWKNNQKEFELDRSLCEEDGGHAKPVWSIAVSNDGKTIISGDKSGVIKIWRLVEASGTWELNQTLNCRDGLLKRGVLSIFLSADGKTMASASQNDIQIWNLNKDGYWVLSQTLHGHTDFVNSIKISTDGQTMVSASGDNSIMVWQLDKGGHWVVKQVLDAESNGHTMGVNSVTISEDGQTIVSGSVDRTVKVWNLNNGLWELTQTLDVGSGGHNDHIRSVAISDDGQTIVSGSADRTVKVWSLVELEDCGINLPVAYAIEKEALSDEEKNILISFIPFRYLAPDLKDYLTQKLRVRQRRTRADF